MVSESVRPPELTLARSESTREFGTVGNVELRGNVSVALTDPLELADVEGPNGKGQSTSPCVTSCSAATAVTTTAGPTAAAATSTTASWSATATASFVDYGHLTNAGCSSSTNFLNNSTPSRSSSRPLLPPSLSTSVCVL
uniref:Uncharacterized protein n=1 Tax=Glossina pallidipes TaxID=7398 RepID=A0A1A9ZXR6_GLOPL